MFMLKYVASEVADFVSDKFISVLCKLVSLCRVIPHLGKYSNTVAHYKQPKFISAVSSIYS